MKKILALVLALALCAGLLAGCGGKKIAGYALEKNEDRHAESFPYLVRTPSATWYLAAADIELIGEEAFFSSFEQLLQNQEADFADARAALADYLPEEVPSVDIYTDFIGRTEKSALGVAAVYEGGRTIRVYRNWNAAEAALLHEYVHYLSFYCCDFTLRDGFWAEALADCVAMLLCENRMARAVNLGMEDAAADELLSRGAGDAEGRIDPRSFYYGMAQLMRWPDMVGEKYFAVSNATQTMTERQIEHPTMSAMSYYEASCLLEYLIKNYGTELVFAHLDCGAQDFETIYGKDFETICAEWYADNTALCAELGFRLG